MGPTKKPLGDIWVGRKLKEKDAFRKLKKTSILVYLDFLGKKQTEKKTRPGRADEWIIKNNGEIIYTYKEAEGRGISRASFRDAIDDLIAHGFIDIAEIGSGGRKGDVTKYAISDRWKHYGTDKFVEHKRRPDTRKGRGWAEIMADPERRKEVLRKRKKSIFGVKINTPKRAV